MEVAQVAPSHCSEPPVQNAAPMYLQLQKYVWANRLLSHTVSGKPFHSHSQLIRHHAFFSPRVFFLLSLISLKTLCGRSMKTILGCERILLYWQHQMCFGCSCTFSQGLGKAKLAGIHSLDHLLNTQGGGRSIVPRDNSECRDKAP